MADTASQRNPIPLKRPIQGKSSLKATIKDQSGAGKTRIGEILCKEGYITSNQLQEALNYQKKNNGRLGSILIRLGYIDEETIISVLSRLHHYPPVVLSRQNILPETIKVLPYDLAKKFMVFPLKLSGDILDITMVEPTDSSAVEELQSALKKNLRISISTEKDIVEAFKKHYNISDEEYQGFIGKKDELPEEETPIIEVEDFGSLVSEATADIQIETPTDDEDSSEYSAASAPIIKLVNGIMLKAVRDGVSDIHIEPFEKSLQVRYRLDGALYKSMNLPLSIKNALVSRVKILAGLNIAERRVPQDGRIKMRLGKEKAVDFRVSSLPTLFGEGIVMRILDPGALNVDLTKLGFEEKTFDALKRCIYRPFGLLLVTGPTGSGKTTTLYSILNALNKEDTKILTAEDPVEFNFRGINQVLVRNEVGMTFAAALKAFLRQDPDIIMVGEIRDMETAEIAIKAAMTGHLVFSTLHTNDCPSTIGRLVDIGIPPYMLASAVTMVLSQRLVRKLCKCKEKQEDLDPKQLEAMGFSKEEIPNLTVYRPKGCELCKGTGYKGRIGLYELMEVTEDVSKAINAQRPGRSAEKDCHAGRDVHPPGCRAREGPAGHDLPGGSGEKNGCDQGVHAGLHGEPGRHRVPGRRGDHPRREHGRRLLQAGARGVVGGQGGEEDRRDHPARGFLRGDGGDLRGAEIRLHSGLRESRGETLPRRETARGHREVPGRGQAPLPDPREQA